MANRQDLDAYVLSRAGSLMRLAVATVGDRGDAEDALQDTLVAVYVHWRRIRPTERDAYVRTALMRRCIDTLRRRGRRPATRPAQADDAHVPDPATAVADTDQTLRLLRTLPPRQRAVLALRYLDDQSDQQIAQILGISPRTVKATTSHALSALRRTMSVTEGASR
jgi:RNA polymerase sigma-70 factor (sigma-E family)